MFCGDESLIGVGAHDVKITPLYCRRWSCPTCFPARLMQLRNLAASGHPSTFITLTINPAAHSDPASAARALVRAWRNIRQRAARENVADSIPFIAVFEETKRGWPHLHILCRAPFIEHAWLSARCAEYLGSPIVDIRAVKNRRHASRYIAKYLAKGPADYPGSKRYFRSRDYAHPNDALEQRPREKRTWWHSRNPPECVAYYWQRAGWMQDSEENGERTMLATEGARWPTSARAPPESVTGFLYDRSSGCFRSVAACSPRQWPTRSALRHSVRAERAIDESATRCSQSTEAGRPASFNER